MNQKGNILIFMLVPIGLVLVLGAGIGVRYYTETVKTTPNQIGLSTEEIQQPIVEVSGIKLDEQSESQSIDKVLETELRHIRTGINEIKSAIRGLDRRRRRAGTSDRCVDRGPCHARAP